MASDYGAALLQDEEAHWERAEVVSKLYDGEGCELVERWFRRGVGLCVGRKRFTMRFKSSFVRVVVSELYGGKGCELVEFGGFGVGWDCARKGFTMRFISWWKFCIASLLLLLLSLLVWSIR